MEGGGVEVTDRKVKYLSLAGAGTGERVRRWGEEDLPPGVIEQGDIRDEEALVATLARVRERAGFFLAHASLPEQKGYLFELELPRAALGDLSDSVAFALPGYVPLSPAEVVFDCEAADAREDATAVAVTAFPENVALAYSRALGRAGFLPLSMELEPQAAARAALPRALKGAQLLIDYSAMKTMLAVSVRGSVRFAASFEGSGALDDGLLKSGISAQELIALKREEGLGASDEKVRALMSRHLDKLSEEIGKHVRFWNARSGATREPIVAAWLSGGNANMRGLAEALSQALGLPVRPADVWQNLPPEGGVTVPPIEREESFRFATVLGLAMRSRSPFL